MVLEALMDGRYESFRKFNEGIVHLWFEVVRPGNLLFRFRLKNLHPLLSEVAFVASLKFF